MKKIFFDAIRSGAKTATLRYWRSPRVRVNTVHRVPGLGRVRIEDVRNVEFSQLTDHDAQVDGFHNLSDLCKAMDKLYPNESRGGRELYQIRFTFIPTDQD